MHLKPLLFCWIPKTAGTSVFKAIKELHGMNEFISDYHKFDNRGNVTFGHADLLMLVSRQIISKQYWDSAYKFSIIRNPYDRFVSLYHDFKKTGRIAPDMTMVRFAHMLKHVSRDIGMFNAFDFSQCASQVRWLLPGMVTYRFEKLNELENSLGIKIVHQNKGTDGNFMQHYDDELIRLVTELYYDDLTFLKYDLI